MVYMMRGVCKFRYNVASLVMVLAVFISLSPLLCGFLGVNGNLIYIVLLTLSSLLLWNVKNTPVSVLLFILILLLSSVCFSLYWQDFRLVIFPLYLIISVFSFASLVQSPIVLGRFIEYVSLFTLLVVIGAVIGFIYGFVGGTPILEIQNPDGRTAALFLTSMSNWYLGNIIRPSGIFDEPGALSFIICSVCSLRELTKKSRNLTWIILISGLVTMSVAHIIYLCLFLFTAFTFRWRSVLSFGLIIATLVAGLFFANDELVDGVDRVLFSRFEIVDGKLAGDNRTELLANAYDLVLRGSILWGIDSDCILSVKECDKKYEPFGENVLSLIALVGILVSAPYYICLVVLSLTGVVKKQNLHLLGFSLMLTQRPYLFSFGYSGLIVTIMFFVFKYKQCQLRSE